MGRTLKRGRVEFEKDQERARQRLERGGKGFGRVLKRCDRTRQGLEKLAGGRMEIEKGWVEV